MRRDAAFRRSPPKTRNSTGGNSGVSNVIPGACVVSQRARAVPGPAWALTRARRSGAENRSVGGEMASS